jgi:hypothetical protein
MILFQAGESWWTLEGDEVQVMLPKDDAYFWKGLFEGGEEKSHYQVRPVFFKHTCLMSCSSM